MDTASVVITGIEHRQQWFVTVAYNAGQLSKTVGGTFDDAVAVGTTLLNELREREG